MVWLRGLLLLLAIAAAPASAHKEHKAQEAGRTQQEHETSPGDQVSAGVKGGPAARHAQMGEMMGKMEHEFGRSFGAKLLDWLGRTHPVIVHFPIAFFPAALFTAVVGRRREGFAKPVQFLVVAGGIIAPVAALLGWFDALGAGPDPLLTVHRWLGTAIGIAALALALWAWRRPDEDRSLGMIAGLATITAAIVVQGWYGGALVHGIDHMNW